MIERNFIFSPFYAKKFKIHGHLAHDHAPNGKIRWFIYKIHDIFCNKIIIGSTQNPKERWANYKSCCNRKKSNGTGLCKHFMDGCPNDTGPKKKQFIGPALLICTPVPPLVVHKSGHLCRWYDVPKSVSAPRRVRPPSGR